MSLFSTLTVSATGMAAQRTRAELLVQNMANAETTRTGEGGPYRRQDVVFESTNLGASFGSMFDAEVSQGTGVTASQFVTDNGEPDRRYLPGHPDADANGYVAFPRINVAEEMVDLVGASRGYQANVASMTATKEMIQRSIDLLR